MDKYEYRVCVEEINALIAERRFSEAMDIADTIDWKRVKNVNMLCKISDLYKINRHFEESRDILEMAHERYPGGRSIVYSLCELELRLNEFVKAVAYYNDFVAMAPRDPGRYILQYKIMVAQGVSVDERIEVLEELKKHDYREKWAYTLAALYNQAGMTAKCAQECDEMIAAFGDGRYVIKALQLKQEKTPLTADQTTRLEELTRPIPAQQIEEAVQQPADAQEGQYGEQPSYAQESQYGEQPVYAQAEEPNGYAQDEQYAGQQGYDQVSEQNSYGQEQSYDRQDYNQEAYGRQVPYENAAPYAGEAVYGQEQSYPEQNQDVYAGSTPYAENAAYGAPQEQYGASHEQQSGQQIIAGLGELQEEIQVKPLDESQFNTINLQQTVAAGVKELLKQESPKEDDAARRAARSAAILKELQENEDKQEAQDQQPSEETFAENTEAAGEQEAIKEQEAAEKQEITEELIGARAYAAQEEAQEEVIREEGYSQPLGTQEINTAQNPENTTASTAEYNGEDNKEDNREDGTEPRVTEEAADVQEAERTAQTSYQSEDGQTAAFPAKETAPAPEKQLNAQDDFAVLEREVERPAEGSKASWGELPGEALWQQTPEQVVSSAYDAVLAQETDGQYSMALEESEVPEKQITGQLDIEGIMAEWEKIRRDNEEKRAKENRQRVLQNTGPIIAKFEETSKKGVLEHMEREIEAEARVRREKAARPAGSVLSDGLTTEERQSAAVAAGHSVERAILEDDIADEATKKWSPSAVLRTLRKEQALQNLPEDYFSRNEEGEQAEQEPALQDTDLKTAPKEAEPEEASYVQREEEAYSQNDTSYEQEQNDAYEDDRQDEVYLQEEETQDREAYAEDSEDDGEAPQAYADRQDLYEDEEEASDEDEDGLYEERDEEPVSEDEQEQAQEEAQKEDMPVRRARNTPVEALHETQDLTEFAKGKYGDPEEMTESQKEERRRSVDENRSQRDHSASEEERVRAMTREERALFGPYLSEKNSRRQILQAIENVSLAACTGNVIVTGDDGPGALNLAKGLIREIQLTDQNFSGKVARSTGEILNRRDFAPVIDRLKNGALIIERAGELNDASVKTMRKALQSEERGFIVILVDTKKAMDNFLAQHQVLEEHFTARVDIQALDNDTLVRYARAYARSKDYSIDEFGILALHTRISSKQTIDHNVTMREVRDMVDDAIYYASKKSLSHLMDILLRKRYDEDDRIILREKDFQHY